MLTKELANRIIIDWEAGNDTTRSSIQRFESKIRASIALTEVLINMANNGATHWNYSGLAAQVAATANGEAVGDGQLDAEFIRKYRAMWSTFNAWLATPIATTLDGQPVSYTERPIDMIISAPTVVAAE